MRKIATHFYLSILLGLSVLICFPTRVQAVCEVQVFWRLRTSAGVSAGSDTDFAILPNSLKTGTQVTAVAKYIGCAGEGNAQINIFHPINGRSPGSFVPITQNNQEITRNIIVDAEGQYTFNAFGVGTTTTSKPAVVVPAVCEVNAFWRTNTTPPKDYVVVPINPKVGTTYTAIAHFRDCQGKRISVSVWSPTDKREGPNDQDLGATETWKEVKLSVRFAESGGYRILAKAYTTFSAINAPVAKVTVDAGTPPSGTPTPPLSGPGSTTPPSGEGGPTPEVSTPESGGVAGQIPNLLPFNDLLEFFIFIIKTLLVLIGIFATAMIIAGGYRMVISQGNSEQLTKAKNTVVYAVIGLAVAFLSFSIIAAVQNVLKVQ